MHPPIFGHSFAVLAAPILLSVLAFNFLNRKRATARRNAEDADAGAAGPSASPVETDSGASSSSTASTGDHYEVFLNFRGPDTRKGFTSHLYDRLVAAGIDVFLDDNKLRQGEEIGPDLLEAIKNSKISIPILSVNYCASKWCLDELVQIMECENNKAGHIVLPIFYKVEPAHVRYQIGSFGDALYKRKRPFDRTTLEKYKQALTAVSNLKGWEVNKIRNEAVLVRLIVQTVSNKLKKDYGLLIPKNLVGIENPVKKVMIDVANNSNVTLFIGIYGMGGIGKTTLASIIFNKLSDQFDSRSFIPDIRESCNRKGLESLQNKLIFDILGEESQVHDKHEGTMLLSSKFKKKKVLILLDDVGHYDQLKALAGNHNWFYSGSRILITSRDKSILAIARVDYDHKLEELDKNQSLILFCKHAFRTNSPSSEFKGLAREVVSKTGGLPLSLEVIGSFLSTIEPTQWGGMIEKLGEVLHEDVKKRLKISYDALGYHEQQIFLDVACFLIGTDGRIASYMWDACGYHPKAGIAKLSSMSLIKFGDNHELRMHDQLRDLGREIVREEKWEEPQYHSRLWESKKVLKVLKGNKGTEKIKAIYFNKFRPFYVDEPFENFEAEPFEKLTRLRFLDVSGACLRGDFKNSMGELKWLRWQNCPSNFEVNNFRMKELVVLDLSYSTISDEWQGWSSMMAEKLKYLDLKGCQFLRSTVFLSAFKNLEVLILQSCSKVEQIDSSIGEMKKLVRLELKDCRSLEVLPDSIGALQNLEILNIRANRGLELTDGIFRLRKLRDLDASNVTFRGTLDFFQLNQLRTLSVTLCYNIHKVRGLDKLEYLESLIFKACDSIERLDLPKSKNLKTVCVRDCKNLVEIQSLNQLEFLENLELSIYSVEKLDLSKSKYLKKLGVVSCESLVEIQGLDRMMFLESLQMLCVSIERLDLSKSNGPRTLCLEFCENLVEIQGLNKLTFLEEMIIRNCNAIEQLDLLDPEGLKFLREIDIGCCNAIEQLDLSKCEGLKILKVFRCKNLVEIQVLDKLEFLEKLKISFCTSLIRLPNLCCFDTLQSLAIDHCDKLHDIQNLERLTSCETLYVRNCEVLAKLPNLSNFHNLRTLFLLDCHELREIPGLEELTSLRIIAIRGCSSIESLPDFSSCTNLNALVVQDCVKLTELQGLEKLEQLRQLDISGCKSLKTIPELCRGRLHQNYEINPYQMDPDCEDTWLKTGMSHLDKTTRTS